jgi:tetratricopeptide (TPR) repeat protein
MHAPRTQAVDIKPAFEQGHVYLGVAQFASKDYIGARRSYQNALNLNPDNEEYKKAIEACKDATDKAATENVRCTACMRARTRS